MRVVLVVDDDDSVREFICAALQGTDVIVLPVSSADEAVKALEARRVHVALVDVGLPDIDGRELARTLTGMQPELRVHLMSGEELPGCLLKPLGVAQLRNAVRRKEHDSGRHSSAGGSNDSQPPPSAS